MGNGSEAHSPDSYLVSRGCSELPDLQRRLPEILSVRKPPLMLHLFLCTEIDTLCGTGVHGPHSATLPQNLSLIWSLENAEPS